MSSQITSKFLVQIWAALLVMLFVSLGLGTIHNHTLSTILVFGVATLKMFLVVNYYMGIRYEPKYILWMLLSAVVAMFVLYFALVPDIIWVNGRMN